MTDAPQHHSRESEAEIAAVQRWRRRVVRLWIATMVTAIGVWGLFAAVPMPWVAELGAGALLVLLASAALWQMRRGVCPRCGMRIRFEPRIELPRTCPHCSASFVASP